MKRTTESSKATRAALLTGVVMMIILPGSRILAAGNIPAADRSMRISTTGPTQLEREMLILVDDDRENPANLAETSGRALPLVWDERLAEVARERSADMIARSYFGHVNPDGVTPDVLLTKAGIPWKAMSENIVIRTTIERGENAFMDEPRFQPNHRGAILNATYTHVGIGIVKAPNGELYITQEFARY
jgi:Cysteine-rich secretory protein family